MENQYCLFYKNDKIVFGWIREVRKNKLVVLPEQGKEFTCASSRLEYIWEGLGQSTDKEALAYLSEKSAWSRRKSNDFEIEVIHELCQTGDGYSVDELSEDFLDNPADVWLRAAFFICLKSSDKYFQYKKNLFYPRTSEEIEKFELAEIKKQETEKRHLVESAWAEKMMANQIVEVPDEETEHWEKFLSRVAHFLTYWEKSSEKEYFSTLFRCSIHEQEKSERKILDYLGNTEKRMSWGELIVRRALIETEFDTLELKEISDIVDRNPWETAFGINTEDLRETETFTVDNEDTHDFDDAISWSRTEDGDMIVRVHIADVASYMDYESRSFEMARRRFSTLYTIKTIYPMFHRDLSEGVFSLKAGDDRPVMTFEVLVNPSGEIIDSRIFRSVIKVNQNLSYTAVEGKIGEDGPWLSLWETCQKMRQIRIDNGSLELDRVEIQLDIGDPDNIQILEARQNTPATMMIQELAILANYLAAKHCVVSDISALYRTQPPYAITKELAEGEKLTIRDVNIQPAKISLEPDTHSALGLDCYMQVTSPIRRFLDLVNQSIIFASLGEQTTPFTDEDLLIWAKQGEETQKEYTQVERKLLDHWKFKYLNQHADEKFDITVIRQFRNGKSQIIFNSLQLITDTLLDNVSVDENLEVKIERLDPVTKQVHLSVIPSDDSDEEAIKQ